MDLFKEGLVIEDYNKQTDSLFFKLTEKGRKEVKEILKDAKYIKLFKEMILEDIKETDRKYRKERAIQIKRAISLL